MNDPLSILSSTEAAWTMTGLACSAKAAGVLTAAGLVAFVLKGRAAAMRHLVWSLGLAGALAVLPLTLVLPHWGLPVLSAKAESSANRSSPPLELPQTDRPAVASVIVMETRSNAGEAPAAPDQAARIEPVPVTTTHRASLMPWPLAVWGLGTAMVLAWCAVGWSTIWRLGRTAEHLTDLRWMEAAREAAERLGLTGRVTLLRGGPAAMPVTWGVFRPVVLLPAEADAWPAERCRAVLMHELAHVRRRDCLTQWLGLTACAAYWFNPLAWWGASQLRAEREQACDDLVLEAGERPSDYAAELLGVAYSLRPALALTPAAMAMARPSGLERRLLGILDAQRHRRGPARWLMAACLVLVLGASATLAAVRLVAREVPGPVLSRLVVGPDGKPLEGAEVVILLSRPPSRSPMEGPAPAEVLGRGRSDAQGQYRIEVPDDQVKPEDTLRLVVTAHGSGFTVRSLDGLDEPAGEPIRLEAEQPVEVRLVDLEGSPLAGAKVRLQYAYPTTGGEALGTESLSRDTLPELAGEWTTDADGRFPLRGIGPGYSLAFQVRAAGFGSQRVSLSTRADIRTATLTLGRAHIIEGRVILGEGGPPAVGSHLLARSMSEKHGIGQVMGKAEATIDADGRYRIEAAPGGSVRLEVYPPREGADAYLLRGGLVVPGDAVTSRADFTLPRGVLVRGRVTEAGTGQPIAGAVVTHQAHKRNNPYFIKKGDFNGFNGDEQKAITAADGTFRLGVMPGPGYLLVKGPTPDYLHEEIPAVELHGQLIWPNTRHYPNALRKLEPKPDDGPVDLELTLRRGVTVSGHLVGTDRQPVPSAVLFSRWYLTKPQMTINSGQFVLPTRGGRFALGGCDPDSSAPVFFLDAKQQRGAMIELSGKQGGQDVEVTLQPCGSATVRFVDSEGKPLRPGRRPTHLQVVLTPGASFGDILPGADRQSPVMADTIIVDNLDRERYHDLKTDEQGRITFPTLIPGANYRIVVFNQPVKTQMEFTVKPGEAKDLGDLVIPNSERAG